MKISIVTTTKSNTDNVACLIKSVWSIRDEIYEFIIVDAGTPDIEKVIVYDHHKFITLLDGKGTMRGEGKNIGIKEATGDVIVFLNDDVEITKEWLPELKRSLEHSDIVAGYSENPIGKTLSRIPVYIGGQDITWPTCNIVYRKKVIDEVGLFDIKMITAEDIEYNCRCIQKGYVINYNPKMKVHHYHRETFRGFAKQAFWNGYGRKQFNKRHPELKYQHQHGLNPKSIFRLGFGILGYLLGDLWK